MTLPSELFRDQVSACFKRLLEGANLAPLEKKLLRALFEREEQEKKGLSEFDIADLREDASQKGSESRARTAMSKLNLKLRAYYGREGSDDPLRFEISNIRAAGGYVLLQQPRATARPSEESVRFLFQSRAPKPVNWIRKILCSNSEDVLFLTVASMHTLQKVQRWLSKGSVKTKHFRALMWLPPSEVWLEPLAAHSDETKENLAENVKTAWRKWKDEIEPKFDYVEVYGYSSCFPTVQAVGNDEYIKLELLPYNGLHELGIPDNRPGLLMHAREQKFAYELCKQWFDDLWLLGMQETADDEVHERWRHERKKRLAMM